MTFGSYTVQVEGDTGMRNAISSAAQLPFHMAAAVTDEVTHQGEEFVSNFSTRPVDDDSLVYHEDSTEMRQHGSSGPAPSQEPEVVAEAESPSRAAQFEGQDSPQVLAELSVSRLDCNSHRGARTGEHMAHGENEQGHRERMTEKRVEFDEDAVGKCMRASKAARSTGAEAEDAAPDEVDMTSNERDSGPGVAGVQGDRLSPASLSDSGSQDTSMSTSVSPHAQYVALAAKIQQSASKKIYFRVCMVQHAFAYSIPEVCS